jgi:hypothetical protein
MRRFVDGSEVFQMNGWIEHKARRLLIVGALAFAVGAPTVACMGGGEEASDDDDAAGDDDDDDKAEEFDAAEALKGTWQVKPHPDDLRELKVINEAMRPKGDKDKLKKKLSPPPTADELKLFDEVRKMPKNSPELEFLKSMIAIMKDARLKIDDKTYVLTVADKNTTMQYTMTEKSGETAKVTVTNGSSEEKHELTFKGSDEIAVAITSPRPQNLVFKRR